MWKKEEATSDMMMEESLQEALPEECFVSVIIKAPVFLQCLVGEKGKHRL
jgi:hypothetical protein